MRFKRRELIRMVAVVAAAWVLIVLILARWQRSDKPGGARPGPALVHYPGYEGVEEQTVQNLGFRKYWFTLNEDYPSKSVYYFYKNLLEPEGWRPLPRGEPQWARRTTKDEARDVLQTMWISQDSLFQIELEMLSVAKLVKQEEAVVLEEREPGIRVFVTLRRALSPTILLQRRTQEPERGVRQPGL